MKKTLLLAFSILIAGGLALAPQTTTHVAAKSDWQVTTLPQGTKGHVTYVKNYSVALWHGYQANRQLIKGKKLQNGTSWRVVKAASQDGHLWYDLGGSQWVDGRYFTLSNPMSKTVNRLVDYTFARYIKQQIPWATKLDFLYTYTSNSVAIAEDHTSKAMQAHGADPHTAPMVGYFRIMNGHYQRYDPAKNQWRNF